MFISSFNGIKISKNLKKDIVEIAGKIIFINPFLYWKSFDEYTNNWLRNPGQISDNQIALSRKRFYPELDWNQLNLEEKMIKDATVEMFLKTLELISKFNPGLNSRQLIQIEKKMLIIKKKSFEKWVQSTLRKKAKAEQNQIRRLQKERFINNWRVWFGDKTTQQALLPIVVIIFVSAFVGWTAGISKNSCNPYFEPSTNFNF